MAIRGDEVETAVDPVVNDIASVQATLITVILLELLVDVVHNGHVTAMETSKRSTLGNGYYCSVNHRG